MVNMTMDDYIKVAYNSENEEFLMSQIQENEEKAYKERFSGIYRGADGSERQDLIEQLASMNPDEYKYLKMRQMGQLFNAYKERHHANMWVEPTDTDPEHVRRVVGPNARNSLNTGVMALTQDEISAINYLANEDMRSSHIGDQAYTTISLYNATQQLIALRDVTCDRYDVKYPENTISAFARDTVAGELVYDQNHNGHEYGYSLESVEQIIRRCKSPFHRVGKKLIEFLNSRPEDLKNKKDRLGDKTIEIDEQGE